MTMIRLMISNPRERYEHRQMAIHANEFKRFIQFYDYYPKCHNTFTLPIAKCNISSFPFLLFFWGEKTTEPAQSQKLI
jgi:hypothetical protein